MGKLASTWVLMKASWHVIVNNKRLLILPVISLFCLALVLASFLAPVVAANWGVITGAEEVVLRGETPGETTSLEEAGETEEVELNLSLGIWTPPQEGSPPIEHVRFYGVVFAFYFANYFVIIFFNSAVVASALFWMRGSAPSLSAGLGAAVKRLPQIAGWAFLSATVGLLLKVIESSNRRAGQIVASLLGMAWTIMAYLAVPVLVVEGRGPVGSLKESVSLLRKSWGQQLIGGFAFGLIYFLFALVGLAIIAVGIYLASAVGSAAPALLFGAVAVVYFALLLVVSSVLKPVFQAALYAYAKEGRAPGSFGDELLKNAFRGSR